MKKNSHNNIQKHITERKLLSWLLVVVLFVLLYFTATLNGYVTIGSNSVGNNAFLFYLNSFIGIIGMILLSVQLSVLQAHTAFFQRIMNYLKWFGRNSFYAMATHFPIKELVGRFIDKLFCCDVHTDIKYAALTFIITLIINSLVVWMCCVIKSKWNKRSQRLTSV